VYHAYTLITYISVLEMFNLVSLSILQMILLYHHDRWYIYKRNLINYNK